MLPQYGKKNHDPKIHHAPLPMPSLQIVNFVLIIILFILVLWLGSRHYHVTQQAVKHHLGKLQLKSDQTPGSDLHVYELAIREDTVGQFGRYPKQGAIQEMQFQNISRYRLCCTIDSADGSKYKVCDYGPGATNNVGLECMLHSDDGEHAYAAVWIQNQGMIGAQCVLYWWETP